MSNNTQRRIQVAQKRYDHNPSLVWTHKPQIHTIMLNQT